ncbi:hypothetical protein M231_00643 [Tremella mesenterica]|uniref:DUF985 domain-containing protein n=1 Tax=Tremella mesenterica TaxID=5217 RepID=A0A4Q1BV68_TREME|nr:hypothetical protein M231_00643 [Tremella mesenterica]
MSQVPYPYPTSNPELIKLLNLIPLFEGGFFSQTVYLDTAPSTDTKTKEISWGPAVDVLADTKTQGEFLQGDRVPAATQIFYLLTSEQYRGKMHMNEHATFHTHHQGRSLYTLIQPPSSTEEKPKIHRVIVGPNIQAGELLQLYVPGHWWKASEIPEEDLLLLDSPTAEKEGLKDKIGCLISEVVVPGWTMGQHQFLDVEKLKALWNGQPGWEEFEKYTRAPEGVAIPDKE